MAESVSWILDVKPRVDIVPANLFLDFNQSLEVVREVRLFYWDERLAEETPELELSSDLPLAVAAEYKPRHGRSRVARLRFSARSGFGGSARGKLYFRSASSGGEILSASILALRHGELAGANE